ncbi:ShlB/FhaC/HecB family hemolysin secretion/activation protein [Salmonella enterica]
MFCLSGREGDSCRKKTYILPCLITPLAMMVAAGVQAATVSPVNPAVAVNAGSLGNQLRQETVRPPLPPGSVPLVLPADEPARERLAADDRTTVILNRVQFTGNPPGLRGLDEPALQKQVAGFLDRPLTFSGLQDMTRKVTEFYRSHGFLVARAVLPAQTIRDGVLTIEIIPGRYDAAVVKNTSPLKSSVAERMVRTGMPEGAVVKRRQLEREALLLNEIPGVSAQVSMNTGTRPGTTQPQITLSRDKRYGGYVGLDNQGDPSTGRSRVMAGFYANELLGYGDRLRIDLMDAYEKSDLFNGALDYSLLVGGYGTRAGINYSHLNYRYTLNGSGFEGYSDNWGLYVTHPWIRTAEARVDVRLDAGQQFLTDKYPQLFAQTLGYDSRNGRRKVDTGTLSLQGAVASVPGGVSAFTFSGTVGNMDYRNDMARFFGSTEERYTSGQFSRFNYMLDHTQQVWGPFSFYASLNGQMASQNLDSSQKFLMGGPNAVRAYDIGDGSVDTGNVVTAEVRSEWGLPWQGIMGNAPSLTVAAFYDQGWGEQLRDNYLQESGTRLVGNNHFSLAGSGLYATVSDAGNYALTLTWARRTGNADPVSGHDDRNRFWVSAVKTF